MASSSHDRNPSWLLLEASRHYGCRMVCGECSTNFLVFKSGLFAQEAAIAPLRSHKPPTILTSSIQIKQSCWWPD